MALKSSYQRTVRWTRQGLTEPFKNIVGCCNFTEVKSREVCTVLVDKQLFLKNRMTLPNKRSVGPSSRLKTVDLDYRSSLSLTRLVRFWFKSLQSFTAHDGQFPQGNLFLLAVCTHKVPLYLCSIFCSHSLVQVSTASYRILSHGTRPKLYPVTLNKIINIIDKGFKRRKGETVVKVLRQLVPYRHRTWDTRM